MSADIETLDFAIAPSGPADAFTSVTAEVGAPVVAEKSRVRGHSSSIRE